MDPTKAKEKIVRKSEKEKRGLHTASQAAAATAAWSVPRADATWPCLVRGLDGC